LYTRHKILVTPLQGISKLRASPSLNLKLAALWTNYNAEDNMVHTQREDNMILCLQLLYIIILL